LRLFSHNNNSHPPKQNNKKYQQKKERKNFRYSTYFTVNKMTSQKRHPIECYINELLILAASQGTTRPRLVSDNARVRNYSFLSEALDISESSTSSTTTTTTTTTLTCRWERSRQQEQQSATPPSLPTRRKAVYRRGCNKSMETNNNNNKNNKMSNMDEMPLKTQHSIPTLCKKDFRAHLRKLPYNLSTHDSFSSSSKDFKGRRGSAPIPPAA
jgi:hypothetical protein